MTLKFHQNFMQFHLMQQLHLIHLMFHHRSLVELLVEHGGCLPWALRASRLRHFLQEDLAKPLSHGGFEVLRDGLQGLAERRRRERQEYIK